MLLPSQTAIRRPRVAEAGLLGYAACCGNHPNTAARIASRNKNPFSMQGVHMAHSIEVANAAVSDVI
jgi:hypothetical protein